jgi:hypothetical protein
MTTLKRRSAQLLLDPSWDDISILNYHDGIVIVGDFFEELSANAMHLPRLATNGQDTICPDLRDDKLVVESKACNAVSTGRFMVWDHQLENYEGMTEAEGVSVFYLFWQYRMSGQDSHRVGDYKTRSALRNAMARSDIQGWFMPLSEMACVARTQRLQKYTRGANQNPDDVWWFHQVNAKLLDAATQTYRHVKLPKLVVYEHVTANITMRVPKLLGQPL